MLELSLHILDIVNNSIKANADLIHISVKEEIAQNRLYISISDNGCGMDEAFLSTVLDPFQTTRTTRKVGMGLSLFKAAAENAGGDMTIQSQKGVGTTVKAWFVYDHIDRQPMGNIIETILTLISANDSIRFVYTHSVDQKTFQLDTREIKDILGPDVSMGNPEIILWLREYIGDALDKISS